MTAILLHLRYRGPVWLVGFLAFVLIAVDIVRVTGWTWRDVGALLATLRPASGREVRNYVEFIEVPAGAFLVVTGIRYRSSLDGLIDQQWCYVESAGNAKGGAEQKLTLGNARGTDAPVPNRFTAENLTPFGLTAEAALILMNSHCRFRTGGKSAHV